MPWIRGALCQRAAIIKVLTSMTIRFNQFNIRKIILSCLLSATLLFSQDCWQPQNPYPTESYLLAVTTVNSQVVFAAGIGGTLIKSNDFGNSWEITKIPQAHNLRSIAFSNSVNGWLIDSSHLYRTLDGGNTWNEDEINLNTSNYSLFEIIAFADVQYIIARPSTAILYELIGSTSMIYKSMDMGTTWSMQESQFDGKILGTHFLDKSNGYVTVEKFISVDESTIILYSTIDGGHSWKSENLPFIDRSKGIFFFNPDTGFVGNYQTKDGGTTWINKFEDVLSNESIEDIAFEDSSQGWALSWDKFLYTSDGGNTWSILNQSNDHRMMQLHFSENGFGWAAGWAGNIFLKYPNELEWQTKSTGPKNGLNDITFISEDEGWSVGSNGLVMHTSNGGSIWAQQLSHVSSFLERVDFANGSTGCIAGYNALLHTDDSGATWTDIEGPGGWFKDIKYFNEKCVLLIEREGSIFKSEDGGKSWNFITNLNTRLNNIEIINTNTAWIAAMGGLAFTNDQGNTFSWNESPDLENIIEIDFTDQNYGWLLNNGILTQSSIFSTQDAGLTWKKLDRGDGFENGPITTFKMIERGRGWLYSYDDGGYLKQFNASNNYITATKKYGVHQIN